MNLFYITRDVERAVGLLGAQHDYYIITYSNPLAEALRSKFKKQIIVITQEVKSPAYAGKKGRSTLALIRSEFIQRKINDLSHRETPNILVFKNSHQIEKECKKLNWKLLNPSAELSVMIENKLSQYAWLREEKSASLEAVTPHSTIGEVGQFDYKDLIREFGKEFILQYNTGHTGLGTKRITNERIWNNELKRFPKRMVKISEHIAGKMFTLNACVMEEYVICGSTSEQLTGISELTSNPLATVGNDWNAAGEEAHRKVSRIAHNIGHYMMQDGWKGLFGIDVIMPADDGAHPGYLIEINARQPASACLEAQLQKENGKVSLMERHVNTLCGNNTPQPPLNIRGGDWGVAGSQLFFRNVEKHPVSLKNEFLPGRYKVSEKGIEFIKKATSVIETQKAEIFAFSVSQTEKVKPGGELLRIQSKQGIVDTFHGDMQSVITKIRLDLE